MKKSKTELVFHITLDILSTTTVMLSLAVCIHCSNPRTNSHSRQSQIRNLQNLSCIRLAFSQYAHEHNGYLPPAYTVDDQGNRLHSWRALLLPYLGEVELYESINFSQPWNHEDNRLAASSIPDCYQVYDPNIVSQFTTTMVPQTAESLFPDETQTMPGLEAFSNRSSSSLLIIQVDSEEAVHWMSPNDANLRILRKMVSQTVPVEYTALTIGGHSQPISSTLPYNVLKSLASEEPYERRILEIYLSQAGGTP